ncbi:MAG: hypothetical protein ACI4PM_02455 [Butyricicoccus sp.]
MHAKTKTAAIGGVMSAAALMFLLIASVVPGGRLVITALAGVVGAVTVARAGMLAGTLSWIAVSVLALLLLPNKGCAILYAAFFGPYTLIKNLVERKCGRTMEWVLKYLFCLGVAAALFWLSAEVLRLLPAVLASHLWLYLPVVAVAFLAYDIIFSKVIYQILHRLPQN